MAESFLTTHPHIRRLAYVAAALAALAALGTMFGWDETLELGKALLAKAGLIEGGSP